MTQNIIIANWKMNRPAEPIIDYLNTIARAQQQHQHQVIIAPNAMDIARTHDIIKHNHYAIDISAQDCHHKNNGAFTGDISTMFFADYGVRYVLIGHSERREYHNETKDILIQKIQMAYQYGIHVIYCVGEPYEQRQQQTHKDYITEQCSILNNNLIDEHHLTIAYEPIWAIGSGQSATADQANDMHQHIRHLLKQQFMTDDACNIPILYGGSVNGINAKDFFAMPYVNGALVGGASLKSEEFSHIIQASS